MFGPGIDEPLYYIDNQGRRNWTAADERGSIVATANAAGTVGWTGRYDEYGNYASRAYEFGFAGSYWHTPVNLHYMRARWYHPKLGRFLQPDPIGYGGGMNMYAYVKGDPVNLVDPMGLQAGDIIVNGSLPTYAPPPDLTITRLMDYIPGQSMTYTGNLGNLFIGVEAGEQGDRPTCDTPGADDYYCDPVVTGRRGPASLILAGNPRSPGERGAAGNSSGSGDPYKNMKPHPTKPGYVVEKHHQTGKKIIKKAPPGFPWDKFKIFPPLFMFPPDFYNRCSMIAFPDCPKRPTA